MKWVKCQDIAKQIRGVSYSKKDVRDKPFEDCIPILRAGNIDDKSGTIDFNDVYYLPKKTINDAQIMQKGDILIAASSGSIEVIGKSALFDHADKTTFGAFCKVIRHNTDKVIYKYLFYFFRSSIYRRKIKELAQGANINNIRNDDLDSLQIPLPSLSEQRAIVEKLDRAQRLIDIDREMLQRYDALIQSVFLEMFGDPDGSKAPLAELAEINPKKSEIKSMSKGTHVSFLGMSDVGEDGTLSLTETRSIDEVWNGYTYFAEGDVLFAKITPCMENGKGAIATGLTNQIGFGSTEFHVLRPKKKISTASWLFHLTHSYKFRQIAESFMTGSAGQKRVPKHFFQNFKVNIPRFEDQLKFEQIAKKIHMEKESLSDQLQKSESLFSSLVQQAFSKN